MTKVLVLLSELLKFTFIKDISVKIINTFSFQVIKARVKELMIPRFKIICIVDIGQSNNQALLMGSRCLWDSTNDTYSSAEFRNNSLFAIAQVYGVYYEWRLQDSLNSFEWIHFWGYRAYLFLPYFVLKYGVKKKDQTFTYW